MTKVKMTEQEIETKLSQAVKEERRITKEVVVLVGLAEQTKIYCARGYSSMFDYLTKHHGYSEGAANRRINAARVLRSVPEAKEKLESGQLNVTTMAKAQSIFRAQEKASNQKISSEAKAEALSKIENQSSTEAERTLFGIFPAAASEVKQERITVVSEDVSRLNANIPKEVRERYEKLRDLLSHALPNASFIEVADHLMKAYLEEHDKKMDKIVSPEGEAAENAQTEAPRERDKAPQACETPQDHSAATKRSVKKRRVNKTVTPKTRRIVIKRAGGRCEFQDPVSGLRCESTYQLEVDHIELRAFGGGNDLENLRCLCDEHNRYMAEKSLGHDWANKWRLNV